MTDDVRRIELLPKQIQFLRSTAPECGYSGAVRAGKTYALCLKAVMRASAPYAREALVRKERSTLTSTTLVTLLQGDGLNPPVLPHGTYTHNKAEGVIRIRGGGEIVYFGMDKPGKVGSRSLTGVNIDEAVELTEEDYDMLLTRKSIDLPGLTKQVNWACNPGPPSHFLAQRFGLALDAKADEGCFAIQTSSYENTFLAPDYLEGLKRLKGTRYKRLALGLWVGSEGVIYDGWDRQVHFVERDGPWEQVVIGVDDGYTNPCSISKWGIDGDGRMHRIDGVYRRGLLNRDKVAAIVELGGLEADAVIVDAAAAELIAEMRNAGLPAQPGEKDVLGGIQIIQQRLDVAGDGRPRLTVDPRGGGAEDVVREFESYEWKQREGQWIDEPAKKDDHAMDEARYVAQHVQVDPIQIW